MIYDLQKEKMFLCFTDSTVEWKMMKAVIMFFE